MVRTLFISSILFGCLVFCGEAMGQNLVPNPSFEENTGCPNAPGKIWLAPVWEKVGGGGNVNYFHECGTLCCGIPISARGGGYARTGQAHADVSLMYNNHVIPFFVEGNFLGTELVSALDSGYRYEVEFYLSLYDSARFACRNIGVHFSEEQPPLGVEVEDLLDLEPQVRYEGDFLTDKISWMKVGGSFIAQGGEQYMIIGNFDGYNNSDTLNLHEGGSDPDIGYWEVANYFIDDVSVVKDTSYHVGVEELRNDNQGLALYPNPNKGVFTVELKLEKNEMSELELWSVSGQEVYSRALINGSNSLNMQVAQGLYLYRVTVNGEMKWTGKVSISSD